MNASTRVLEIRDDPDPSLVLVVTHRLQGPEAQIQTALAGDVLRYSGIIKIG
jgi:hypothetical protein